MPRDLSTYSPRRWWPPTSSFASTIQVSISDEMVVSVRSIVGQPGREARQHGRDVLGLEMIDHAREHRLDVGEGARRSSGWSPGRVTATVGLKSATTWCIVDEMGLEPVPRRPVGVELQQSGGHPRLEVDADGAHVPEELLRRLLEEKAQAAFAPAARRVEKVGGQARLPGAGGAGDEDRAAAVVPLAAEHPVEMRDARRHALQRGVVLPAPSRTPAAR